MNGPQTSALTKSDRLEAAIDKQTTGALAINKHGQITFVNANEIMEFSKMMALAKQAIPPHLRDNPGACMAVCIQASAWQMSPFAVATKSYVVSDRMSYEAQLIAAVILMRAPIQGRLKYTYSGKDQTRQCTCTAVLDDGDTVDYTTPEIRNIKVQNSPLWKNDPDQQLAYSAARSLARRHFPDVLLGVYTPEEMAEELERDVTPIPGKPSIGTEPPKTIPAQTVPGKDEGGAGTAAEADGPTTPTAPQTGTTETPKEVTEEDRKQMVDEVNEMRDKAGIATMAELKKRVVGLGWAQPNELVNRYSADTLQKIKDNWQQVLDFGKEPAAE